ncbi:hypothetical protein BC936DRAFT_139383 [Jimgerdemannia flammicorona]|uniref:Uncharacterized protein n=1 Tax=Jimgerdemannia flammicorona TaxID=994334 RepID=A0A433DHS2_9FUNG|nr:hypothetical protein BC936DRAFT_139383 [Jimgerdemannia flammicorona]
MENLYRKAHLLQKEILKNATITHTELLSILEPYVAKSYRRVLDQGLTLKDRFCTVTKDLYQRSNTSVAISSINTKAILKILKIDDYALIANHKNRKELHTGPREALEKFQIFRQKIQAENEALVRRLDGELFDQKWDMTTQSPEDSERKPRVY